MEWKTISKEPLQESFIREHKEKLDWYLLSRYQTFQEDFISEMKEYVQWYSISLKQELTLDFILESIAYVHIKQLKDNLHYKDFTTQIWEKIEGKKKEILQSYLTLLHVKTVPFNNGEALEYICDVQILKEFSLAKKYPFLEVEIVVSLQIPNMTQITFFSLDEKTKERVVVPLKKLHENEKERRVLVDSVRSFLQEKGEGYVPLRFKN